jgi:cytochrome c oxidase subunit I
VAFLLGGINFITTAMNSRAPGMRMYDVPIVVWMIVIASILFMASVGPLIAGAVMLLFDQTIGTGFFDPEKRRRPDPLAAPLLVLRPPRGLRRAAAGDGHRPAEIIATFARKKLFAYKTVLYTVFATGVMSFFVWAHHQFIAGIDPRMANVFTVTTLSSRCRSPR